MVEPTSSASHLKLSAAVPGVMRRARIAPRMSPPTNTKITMIRRQTKLGSGNGSCGLASAPSPTFFVSSVIFSSQ